ncbi:glycoside hydrolase family 3 N-terminal domain-containing protein [Alteromonas sp. H39]|uniref:glycoside hydrolase family 3 N-terminal domain-containing protein n=1 Tax=Alteromonas sp. H39 TaxID=3389876 RepID=UPI0039E16F9D
MLVRTLCLLFFVLSFPNAKALSASGDSALTAQIGQKMMLDFRYFCDDGTASNRCRKPVLSLTPEMEQLLVSKHIGGVLLFSENLEDIPQIIRLNYQLQALMKKHNLPPLFIAIDQEGGRVARLHDHIATRFVGNMAIGATYPVHGTAFATDVAKGIAREIKMLGFNVNFAPTVDVNSNPDNPVINVRSYGEDPRVVAALGQATVIGMQEEGVLSAIKHFPGHGDTHVDSHTGLPVVSHDRATINRTDVYPFARIIAGPTPPSMVMTAHIQYPQLDDTRFQAKDGKPTIVPATMSKKILTGVLRQELAYDGLIVTDALDMAGIAHYFSQSEAVIRTFGAGADIALMPVSVRTPGDISTFKKVFDDVANAVKTGRLDTADIARSARRIAKTKASFGIGGFTSVPLDARIQEARAKLPLKQNKKTEQALAKAALTLIKGKARLPLSQAGNWHFVMPDEARCKAMLRAVEKQQNIPVSCQSLASLPPSPPGALLRSLNALVVADITPQYSVAEMGGMDDLASWRDRADKPAQYRWMRKTMQAAKDAGVPVVMVALRAPYVLAEFSDETDIALTTYGYNVTVFDDGRAEGAVFDAIYQALSGRFKPSGTLPVTVRHSGNSK